jgi:hypothetical protein
LWFFQKMAVAERRLVWTLVSSSGQHAHAGMLYIVSAI